MQTGGKCPKLLHFSWKEDITALFVQNARTDDTRKIGPGESAANETKRALSSKYFYGTMI
jgi:hypothetical protein